jgi:chorismate mutase
LASVKSVAEFDLEAAAKRATEFKLPAQTWLLFAQDCVEYCKQLEPLVATASPLGLVQEAQSIVDNVNNALLALQQAPAPALVPNSGIGGGWPVIGGQLERLCRGYAIKAEAEKPEGLDVRRRLRDLISYLQSLESKRNDISQQVAETRKAHAAATHDSAEIAQILQDLKDAPSRWSALTFSEHFAKQATDQDSNAYRFFGGAVAVAVVLTAFLTASIWCDAVAMPDRENAALVAEVTARGILVLVWLGVIAFLFRQYRTGAHMADTNRHRAAVLKTYALIVKSTDDQPTKAALAREAASCIFQPGNTGLQNDKDELAHQQLSSWFGMRC